MLTHRKMITIQYKGRIKILADNLFSKRSLKEEKMFFINKVLDLAIDLVNGRTLEQANIIEILMLFNLDYLNEEVFKDMVDSISEGLTLFTSELIEKGVNTSKKYEVIDIIGNTIVITKMNYTKTHEEVENYYVTYKDGEKENNGN